MKDHRPLCRLEDIPDGGTLAFPSEHPDSDGLFAFRRGAQVLIYVNACPHLGVSLDWSPGAFLSSDTTHFVCAMHWAKFDIETGQCFDGPCVGEHLKSMPFVLQDGVISVTFGTRV